MSTVQGFGKPKYGGGSFAKTIRLKEGAATVVRILPPMKSCMESGEWAVYIGTHFGYKGVNNRDPSKPVYRTYRCVKEKDFKTGMILQDCPECDLIDQREKDRDIAKLEAEKEKNEAGKAKYTEAEVKEIIKPLTDWLSDHNCDRKWHINVKTQQGEYGVLQISHKTKKKLEAKILALQTEDGIDALDLGQGVWFVFKRTGKGIETDDTVDVEYETVKDSATGRVSRTVKLAPLSDAEAMQALKECPDLAKNVREISYDQILMLTQCSGEPEDVDEILALGQKKESSPEPKAAPAVKAAPQPAPVAAAPAETKQAPVPADVEQDAAALEEAAALAVLERIRVKKANAAAAGAAPTQVVETPAVVPQAVAATPAAAPSEGIVPPGGVNRAAFMARFKKPATP